MVSFTESGVEDAAIAWLESLGYAGPDIAAGMLGAERGDTNYRDVVLERNRAVHQRPRQTRFTVGGHR